MKLAPTPTCASRTAPGGWLARALRAGAAAVMLAAVASSPALAQRHGGDRGDPRLQDQRVQQDPRAMPQRAPEQAPPQPRFEPRAFDSREFDDRRQEQAQRPDPRRAPTRMTPDERRDLRRQINEAGMDLYTRPPRH
jgi:hypothetical protein